MIADAVSGFFQGVVKPVLDKFVPDAVQRLEAENMLYKGALAIDIAQIEVNKVEAASQSVFVAGWRPAIGWICGAAYAWEYVAQPMLTYILLVSGVSVPPLPRLDVGELSMLLMGMLGLGTLRSVDKYTKK